MMLLMAFLLAAPPDAESVAKELGRPPLEKLPEKLDAKYLPDSVKEADVLSDGKKHPLRIAVLRAVNALAAVDKLKPIQEILEKRLDIAKRDILEFQEDLAAAALTLREAIDELDDADPKKESSERWKAHREFLLAYLKQRTGMLEELNLAYGLVHRNELPKLDEAKMETGWKLSAAEKMISKANVRELVEAAHEEFAELQKTRPGTPWAMLAEREAKALPGLAWQAAEVKPPPVKPDPKKKKP